MPDPLTFVLFGASGDLTHRMILPALSRLAETGQLPDPFVVVGVARTKWSDEEFQKVCVEAAEAARHDELAVAGEDSDAGPARPWSEVVKSFRYLSGDYDADDTFAELDRVLREIDDTAGTMGNRIFYLATVPSLFGEVAAGLGHHSLNKPGPHGSFARLVVEKPFGSDLASAEALDATLHQFFDETQIFRIDHYMGKETVQNVLALRFANAIFEPIWNRRYVDHIQVTVAESLGVEHRGAFYENAGALRDIVQNHVMQVLAFTLMESPSTMDPTSIRDEKVKLLKAIVRPSAAEVAKTVVRGQYDAGTIDGVAVPAYREEEGVAPRSTTETFIALHLQVDNWRWAGVPVFVRTGKRLAKRATQVAMIFQRAPHLPFAGQAASGLRSDALVLRIQPDEGISLSFGAKVPGPAFRVRTVAMDFSYQKEFGGEPANAYERLLLDAMIGDPTLFIRTDEVEQAWSILAPIQDALAADSIALSHYPAGSWGPEAANTLLESTSHVWHNP